MDGKRRRAIGSGHAFDLRPRQRTAALNGFGLSQSRRWHRESTAAAEFCSCCLIHVRHLQNTSPVKPILLLLISTIMLQPLLAEDTLKLTALNATPEQSTLISGKKASEIIKAFTELPWDGTPGSKCHHPAYEIIFKIEESKEIKATICFACRNVRFIQPEDALKGFENSEKTQEFHALLNAEFQGNK